MSFFVAIILAALTFALRVADHPWNAAPTAAAMLFAGAVLPRRWGWMAPLAGSLLADRVIGSDHWQIEAVLYGTFLAIWGAGALIGRLADRGTGAAGRIAVLSLAGSVAFFATSNWAVWMWSGIYPATWNGLVQSYVMAVPFFRNTLVGDVLYAASFFACYAAAAWVVRHREQLFDRNVLVPQRDE